jgi:hypothetical protein
MEAIAELHSQLQTANEKLEIAQRDVERKRSHLRDLEREKDERWAEFETLSKQLKIVEEQASIESQKLANLNREISLLETQRGQIDGSLDVLPFLFKKLAYDFMDKSKLSTGKLEMIYQSAVTHGFWRSQNESSANLINSSRENLKARQAFKEHAQAEEERRLEVELQREEEALLQDQSRLVSLVNDMKRKGVQIESSLLAAAAAAEQYLSSSTHSYNVASTVSFRANVNASSSDQNSKSQFPSVAISSIPNKAATVSPRNAPFSGGQPYHSRPSTAAATTRQIGNTPIQKYVNFDHHRQNS